jgi:hypothetical protein
MNAEDNEYIKEIKKSQLYDRVCARCTNLTETSTCGCDYYQYVSIYLCIISILQDYLFVRKYPARFLKKQSRDNFRVCEQIYDH